VQRLVAGVADLLASLEALGVWISGAAVNIENRGLLFPVHVADGRGLVR
jgi:hypothetical protein